MTDHSKPSWSDAYSPCPQVQLMTAGFQSEAMKRVCAPPPPPLYDSAPDCEANKSKFIDVLHFFSVPFFDLET